MQTNLNLDFNSRSIIALFGDLNFWTVSTILTINIKSISEWIIMKLPNYFHNAWCEYWGQTIVIIDKFIQNEFVPKHWVIFGSWEGNRIVIEIHREREKNIPKNQWVVVH